MLASGRLPDRPPWKAGEASWNPTTTRFAVTPETDQCLQLTLRFIIMLWQEGYGAFTVSPPDLEKVQLINLDRSKSHQPDRLNPDPELPELDDDEPPMEIEERLDDQDGVRDLLAARAAAAAALRRRAASSSA